MDTTKTEARQHLNAWVEPDIVRQLDERAEAADRSRSAEIRVALREHVARDGEREDRDE